ncbi:probable flavin-containing amine oxidasedehydrogenase [Phialocephala subalpina]|uniref:Probable flavin-containing amine oxidasedehydrogenase n=1 Tax=Phialocephala subalpina TaxID=576137 RepID=A0A1L7X4P3_9HELO|nr:probable flavin-containing amine oxidasedehydrogenase [Phialocephala subalpina]
MADRKRKNVVIIGAGAAGMSCAATLAQHPDDFKVTIIERMAVTGGQATSISLDKSKYGTDWMNDGVQGGSPIFKHTFNFFKNYGHEPQEVKLQVAFGKGADEFWTNCFPSKLVNRFSGDIKKFGKVLKLIKWTMPVLGIVPIRIMLRIFFFSKDFGDKMVYPLMALFLGTGNQTANVACAILERLFDDPNMKLWDYDPDTLLPNLPTMVTFPKLRDFYEDWRKDLESKGVDIRLQTDVTEILQRSDQGVVLQTRPFDPDAKDRMGTHTGPPSQTESFDELVMCVLADDALKILGRMASSKEKFVLGGAKFYDDITITHSDSEYFQRRYETRFDPSLCAEPSSEAQADQITFAKGEQRGIDDEPSGYRPMYYTKSYAQDPKKIEMSFDCSNSQHQFRMDHDAETAPIPYDRHVFQSIFLDKRNRELWTIDEIDESKVIEKKWWHQLGHRWQHYVRVVPGMRFINRKNNTLFAGSWTLVNMHELACVSGVAAAYRLGADYAKFDDFAEDFFGNVDFPWHAILIRTTEKAVEQV